MEIDDDLPFNNELIEDIVQKEPVLDILCKFTSRLDDYCSAERSADLVGERFEGNARFGMYNRLLCAALQFNHAELTEHLLESESTRELIRSILQKQNNMQLCEVSENDILYSALFSFRLLISIACIQESICF